MEECGDLGLQLLVNVLRAADEAHRAHAKAMGIDRLLRRLDHGRMAAEAEIIVGAKIEHRLARAHGNLSALRAGDDAFPFVKARRADVVEFLLELELKGAVHALSMILRCGG